MKKTAVVLFNLGGPDSKEAIRPFLLNFFMDPNIVRLPKPFRFLLANLIAWRRSKKQAGNSYGELGDKSPLLQNSTLQADALETYLNAEKNNNFKTFVAMRYWHPMSDEIARNVQEWNPNDIILLPLYPQYSTTTTRSSWQAWKSACEKISLNKHEKMICCYPFENGFIRANAANVKQIYDKALLETGIPPRVLFSAHGLPVSIIKDGDPYQVQCEKCAAEIVKATGIENLDWQICYQSRVGAQKWLEPSTETALEKAIHDGVPVVILPHAFTQEHVETLVEIEIEYREMAEHKGILGFYRVPTVGTHPDFIRGLADMVLSAHTRPDISSDKGVSLCGDARRCAMRDLKTSKCCGDC